MMSDKRKLLEYLNLHCNDCMEFDDIIAGYIGYYHKDFPAYNINKAILRLHELLIEEIDRSETANRIAKERAAYIKNYLEGKMYRDEDTARQCVGIQIENVKAILDSVDKVAL